jgi:DNA polymerase-3 subunit delta
VNVEELEKELSGGDLRAAYLLAGEEPLLRDDALALITDAALSGGTLDFNLDRLSGDSTTAASLRDAVGALPVMAPRRLVILREPEAGRGSSKALLEALAELVPEVCAQEQTVLVVTAPKADKRARWVKAFSGKAAVVECSPPKPGRAVVSFVRMEAKRQGLSFEKGAAELLASRVGPQLLLLRQEIAKASLLAGTDRKGKPSKVLVEHIEASTGHVAEQPIWDLTDAIGEGRAGDAVGMLSRLLAGGAPAPVVLASLASHFRRLLRVASGARPNGPPFVVRKLESQARRYTAGRLATCLAAIHDADTALKGAGTLSAEMTLERLVLGLAS